LTFANPNMLWLLLAVPPALLGFFWWAGRTRQRLLTQFIQARLLPTLTVGISARRQKIRAGCLVLAVICLIVALARPQWGFDWQEMRLRGLDIVVAVDTSKSMLAEDIAPNRLARAKLAALELMQRARADRLGLVAFAGSAFLQCPLTIDDSAFRQSVEALNVNIIPQGGTAIAEAIETALTAFKEGDNYKVLVLITDGEDHDSGAVEAAEKAAKEGMRIFTIGIGTTEGELLRIKDAQGASDYVRDPQGNVVKSHLNEDLLRKIAGATEGGFYLPLRGAKAIDTLYDQGLAKLPKSEHQEKFVRQYHERYHWPLAVAIVLLLVEMLFPERKREPKARPAPVPSLQAALPTAVALLLLLLPAAMQGSPASALREYKAGQFDQAVKDYEQLLKRKSDDPRLHFNAGAAAYRNRQFEEAAKQFNATQKSPDVKLQGQAYYNEGNALFRLGESNPDPKKRTECWEKALQSYQSAIKLAPQDGDAHYNQEYVTRKLEELKQQQQSQPKKTEPSEAAKKAKAAADEAVRRREYSKALEIMEKQLAQDPTTSYYAEFIERLKGVKGVQETGKP
jgi:Ca-activated chloride channel family protein